MFKSIRWRLALSFAGIALVAAVVLGAVLLAILQSYYSNLELGYLGGNGKFISTIVAEMTSSGASHDEVQSQIENLAFLTQTRIQVYGVDAQLLYDSGAPQKVAVNLGVVKQLMSNGILPDATFRVIAVNPNAASVPAPETQLFDKSSAAANANGSIRVAPAPNSKGVIVYRSVQAAGSPFGFNFNAEVAAGGARSSLTVKQPLLDPQNGNVTGSVKLSEGPTYGSDILTSVARGWVLASMIAVLLAAAIGWFISRRISAPVLALTGATTRMAAGDLSSRAEVRSQDELGQLARSFDEMADQMETTVHALRRFVSDAAHELQTPVTAIRTNLDLAEESGQEEQEVYVSRAQAAAKRLQGLTNDLLDLSRLEARTPHQAGRAFDLAALLRERAEAYASQAEQAGLTFELEGADRETIVHGDETGTQRALDNLIDNACKFTPPGGSVNVSLARERAGAVVSVSDTGIGIPPEDLSLLFNRFHRGRNATACPGSGLGLAIVKAIMERQGGGVTAENLRRGARFTLRWKS